MASQGDEKRRRSFLPAPKRASESQFASPQASATTRMMQSQLPVLQSVSAGYSRGTTQIPSFAPQPPPTSGFREQPRAPPRTAHFMERQKEETAFGTGLHVGARVKIGGVKPGILRYLGPTHLAPGIFCGIELLDPDGNHNGEVNGHRYFFCLPNHGIFAPKEKVCLDTSNDVESLVSDSDIYYSYAGNRGDQRRHKTHNNYAEGEFDSRAFSKSSSLANSYGTQFVDDAAHSRRHRDTEGMGKPNFPSPYNTQTERPYNTQTERPYNTQTERPYNTQTDRPSNTQTGRSESLKPHGFSESSHRLPNSGPPTPGKSNVTASHATPPHYSRAYNKYHEEFYSRRSPAYSSQSDSSHASSYEALTDIQDSISDFETHLERDRFASAYNKYAAKPDSSVENSLMKDTLSPGIKHQLRADSRQYLNFAFDHPDKLNRSRESDERESDSSFADDEFDAKYGNRDQYSKFTDASNVFSGSGFRNAPLPLDQVNTQRHPEHLKNVDARSIMPTEDRRAPIPGRSETRDGNISDNYAIFRAGLDAASSMQKHVGFSGTTHFPDEKEDSGLFTDFHTCNDERISEGGYVFKSGDKNGGGFQVLALDTHDRAVKSPCLQRDKADRTVKERKVSSSKSEPLNGVSVEKPKGGNAESRNSSLGETKADNTEGNVNGPSPEMTQTLEWDYGQEFEEPQSISTSTGTSESLNDRLKDLSDDCEGDMASSITDDSDHEFENIDELSFFNKGVNPAGAKSRKSDKNSNVCSRRSHSVVTCGHQTEDSLKQSHMKSRLAMASISSDSSQETLTAECMTGTPGSVEDMSFISGGLTNGRSIDSFPDRLPTSPGSVVCMGEFKTLQNKTHSRQEGDESNKFGHEDTSSSSDSSVVAKPTAINPRSEDKNSLAAYKGINILGCDIQATVANRKERPLSLLSTASTDTGYVPDTDSELGTLISTTPDTDWVDRLGVSHPTTHAPFDGDVTTAAEKKDEKSLVKSATDSSCKTAVKRKDDDDYNSDLTGNAEDDRVEADRLDGQDSKIRNSHEPLDDDTSIKQINENEKDKSVTPDTVTPESPNTDDFHSKDGKGSKSEDVAQENKDRPRKPIVITKKRSDNVDHKMPNINVTSRLADYIKAPVPVKPKEEREKEIKKKQNKNAKNVSQSSTKSKHEASRASSEDGENKVEEKVEKPKPIIKRERPKSKWDNIMCQIEASKDTVKPITEVKSSLAEYLHSPLPQLSPDNVENMPSHPRKEFKSKLKQLPPPPPKIDFSKVKSKLNVPTAASAIKAVPKREKPPKPGNLKGDNRASRGSSTTLNAESISESNDDARQMSNSSSVLGIQPATSQTELNALENKDDGAQPQGREGLLSKTGSADTKKDSRRSSVHSVKLENTEKPKSAVDQASKASEGLKKVNQATTHQTKKAAVPATKVTRNAVANNIRSVRSTSKSLSLTKKDFEQLESLCDARAEEVLQLKIQLDATIQAFDAMAVLANYCSNELNAFECPILSQKLEDVQKQLEDYAQQIAELSFQKATLGKDLDQMLQEKDEAAQQTKNAQVSAQKEREQHEKLTHDLSDTHVTALTTQRNELSSKHEETVNKLTQFYETQLGMQRQAHERQVSDIMNECQLEINSLKISNLEEIQELRNKHDDQMEELHKQHRNKMEDISLRFEAIKFSLSEKVDYLRKECDDLAVRAHNSEEALQRDSDFKVRIALAPYLNLPSEIESLKSIQGMRLEEIQKLRTKIMDLEKQLEEVPIAREKILSLQQKIENLEAIITIKTEHEKQLHQRCQVLMRKYDRESRANKRISMDFEQIMWRMSQSADFESCDSLTKQQFSQSYSGGGAPESLRHSVSPSRDAVHQVRRRSSKSTSEGDKKLRSKSASSVAGQDEGSYDHTPTSGPHVKHKRSQIAENEQFNRMCQSAGPEVMFELLSDHSSPPTQFDQHEEHTVTRPHVASIFDMTTSYARSLSGVTDSGVYDSLTRSDVFNSSAASTDLELGTSVNLSVTCDSTAEDDHESGPVTGNYHLT